MSSLKECARYANFVERMIGEMQSVIRGKITANVFETTELHKKSSANKDFLDETLTTEYENVYDLTVEQASNLVLKLLNEKLALSNAINNGKKFMEIEINGVKTGIDTALEYTKAIRNVSSNFYGHLILMKDTKKREMTNGFMINVEGNQVGFRYEVEKETKIKFDKSLINSQNKFLKALSDEVSIKVDEMMSADKIEFTPIFNYLDTFEEFLENNK